MTKTRESPSPVLTLALSSKWRGDSVEGEENKRAGRGTGDCHGLRPRNDFVGLPLTAHNSPRRLPALRLRRASPSYLKRGS